MKTKPTSKPKASIKRKSKEAPRDAALRLLKIRREMSIVELTRALKLTETAVRRHVGTLHRNGLVQCTVRQQEKGRPINMYSLTEKASTEYFPRGYEELATELLDTIFDTSGHKGVFDFLVGVNERTIAELRSSVGAASLKERVYFLANYFSARGFMTDIRELPDGRLFLYHQNCAIYNLAAKYRQLCFMELKLIQAVAGVEVIRQHYIFKKHPICGYLISGR